jgi:hypothetical protein
MASKDFTGLSKSISTEPKKRRGCRGRDVIQAYDGKPVITPIDLSNLTGQSGDGVRRVDVIRHGRRLVFEAPAGRLGIQMGFAFRLR